MPLAARSHLRAPLVCLSAIVLLFEAACGAAGAARAPAATAPEGNVAGEGGIPVSEAHRSADEAIESLLLRYWSQRDGYLSGAWPDRAGPTGYWTFAEAGEAVLDAVERTGGARYAGLVRTLYEAQDRRGWRRDFFDDESWMALFLLRAFDVSGDPAYRDRAAALLDDIATSAPDASCCGLDPGGLWWDRAHTQKATASNAGPVIAAVRLHARTGEARWLDFARRTYAWWRDHMVDASGQVVDHLDAAGRKVWWRFSYDQGVMVGAAVELYRATGEAAYLDDARRIAAFAVANETVSTPVGRVLSDGEACGGDCDEFKGIAHRYLAELVASDPGGVPGLEEVLRADAAAVWSLARDAGADVFATAWSGPPPSGASVSAQSAAATALDLEAARAGAYRASPDRSGSAQAEDGVLRGVGLEAAHAGFQGWGYVAGFDADGQEVEVAISVPSTGAYDLVLRYATGGGPASRRIDVNGAPARADLDLPSTGGWDAWGTRTLRTELPAGTSRITVAYDAARGSHAPVNLDAVAVRPARR